MRVSGKRETSRVLLALSRSSNSRSLLLQPRRPYDEHYKIKAGKDTACVHDQGDVIGHRTGCGSQTFGDCYVGGIAGDEQGRATLLTRIQSLKHTEPVQTSLYHKMTSGTK